MQLTERLMLTMEMMGCNLRWKHYLIINVIDTDAPSQRTHSPEAMLQSGAKEKKRVYEQAGFNFTPIVLSVDGLIHRGVEHFLKRIHCSCQPCSQMGRPYCQMCVYVRAQLCLCYHKGNQYAYGGVDLGWMMGHPSTLFYRLLMRMYTGRIFIVILHVCAQDQH